MRSEFLGFTFVRQQAIRKTSSTRSTPRTGDRLVKKPRPQCWCSACRRSGNPLRSSDPSIDDRN